jgi:large subunit ribosomal protein L9
MAGMGNVCHRRNIEKEKQRAEQAAKDVKAKARAMAVALQTIGKFVIKKKVGEGNKIFGR